MAFTPYVPPEQLMKDRSEYARKGISRGKSVLALEYADGIGFIAENPSATLHKISEIYDRLAFAGVGKYSEFDSLRIAGIQLADVRGYSYGREDVTAKTLANAYSQALSAIFTQQMKPYEVEILIAEVGETPEANELFHILFDGSVGDETGFVAMGGKSEELSAFLRERPTNELPLAEALRAGVEALAAAEGRTVESEHLEAAILDRTMSRRKFRRLSDPELAELVPALA
jgi:proteasome alpha subunit